MPKFFSPMEPHWETTFAQSHIDQDGYSVLFGEVQDHPVIMRKLFFVISNGFLGVLEGALRGSIGALGAL